MVDLTVSLGGLRMRTPVTTASGTFGYGTEYVGALDYAKLGAVTVKGVRRDPWPGNPMPRHAEVFGGLVNAIGLQGPGVEAFATHYVNHYVRTVGTNAPPLIVNIWGGSVEEYAEVAARLTQVGVPVAVRTGSGRARAPRAGRAGRDDPPAHRQACAERAGRRAVRGGVRGQRRGRDRAHQHDSGDGDRH